VTEFADVAGFITMLLYLETKGPTSATWLSNSSSQPPTPSPKKKLDVLAAG
jgi:hypothetical protein